ncbi:MAG TPA: hypothetical protein PLI45_04360 [Candidatus Woesebacteria bacterium]|nr:hypothetical protein [Candidatus Woesebacteria bacterium]
MVEQGPRRETVTSNPPILSQEEKDALFDLIIEPSQKIERNNIGRDEVRIDLASNDSIMIVCVSDLHIGSVATDYKKIDEIFDFVMKTENAKMILLGDEFEGTKEKYMNTNVARILGDTETQKNKLVEKLLPLVAKDKVSGFVSNYWGHVGWEEDASTTNPWLAIADRVGLAQERVIRNGGKVSFIFPNGYVHSETIWHNPPGKSKIDTIYGLRNAAFATSESSRTDGYMSGHIHRMGVGKELYSGSKAAVYYISSGTAKGSSLEVPPDRFGVKLGAPLTDPLGQGVIVEPRTKTRKEKSYPFASLEQGSMANDALRLLDWTEKMGMTQELLEKIRVEVEEKPKITLVAGKSRVSGDEYAEDKPDETVKIGREFVKNPYSKQDMRSPYDSLTYNVASKLPVTLHLISNARLGSSSEGFDELEKYHREQIIDDPHSLVVFLRNMIDKDAGSSPHREEILNKFMRIIKGAKDQTLAIMMCESLRNSSWRRKVKTGEKMIFTGEYTRDGEKKYRKEIEYSMPLAPGSYLSSGTDTPLIHHLSMIKLTVGPRGAGVARPTYTGAMVDKLMHHGSYSRPEFGLKRMYDLYIPEKTGFVAGGHMPHAGAMTFYDGSNPETKTPILVAPGWFSKYADSMGKGNVMPGADPGQAIIFMPGNYMAYPTIDAAETKLMQDSYKMLFGLEWLGITDQVLGK